MATEDNERDKGSSPRRGGDKRPYSGGNRSEGAGGNEASRGLRPTPDLIPESEWEQLRLFTVSVVFPWIYGLGQ